MNAVSTLFWKRFKAGTRLMATLACAGLALGCGLPSLATPVYSGPYDLGITTASKAFGINDNGTVVGYLTTSGGSQHSFEWIPSTTHGTTGTSYDLGLLSGTSGVSVAYGINSNGDITGQSSTSTGIGATGTPYLWTHSGTAGSGTYTDLATNTYGSIAGAGQAINSSTQIAYWRGDRTHFSNEVPYHAWLWSSGSGSVLDTGAMTITSLAYGINSTGDVVGVTYPTTDGSPRTAFLYSGSFTSSIGTIGSSGGDTEAFGINAAGEIVGDGINGSGADDAFLYVSPTLHDLGVLSGASSSAGYAIDGYGDVVGASGGKAFIWKPTTINGTSGTMTDLNGSGEIAPGSGWVLQSAQAINSTGEIVGFGTYGGATHAFLIKPN